jgi:thioesterase domain-containing protein
MEHLSVASEDVGASMSPNRKQTHEFVINTLITSGTLKFDLGFNVNQHSEQKIQQLLTHIKQALIDLIIYCKMPLEKEDVGAGQQANVLVNHAELSDENIFDNHVIRGDLAACIMKLNQGNETRKIFCLHPLGGTVSSYVELASEVEEYAAFYGIQAPALASSLRFSSIKSLSQHYVQAIKANQPKGPYIIIGWSLGGSLAYEVALQMQSQGEDIAYLGLFDEAPVKASENKEEYCWYQRIKGLFDDSFDWTNIENYDQEEGVNLLAEQSMNNGFAPESVEIEMMQRYFCYLADTSRALNSYTPESSSLSLDLFKVNKPVKENNEQVDYGWGDISSGSIEILNSQGLHNDMVKTPYVQSLGAQLISRLKNREI